MPDPAPAAPDPDAARSGARTPPWRRFLPLLVIAAGVIAFFAVGGPGYLNLDWFAAQRADLLALVEANRALAALGYIVLYAVVTALSLPFGAILTLAAGFLFGLLLGGTVAVLGATLGAIGVFLAARTAFRDLLAARAGPFIRRLEDGFREDAFNYLLILRLVPLFPFWLINLVPAFVGVPTLTFALATLLGIIPGTFVYASLGNGLGAVLDAGGTPDFGIVFDPEVIGPILALAVLAAVPVVYKRIKAKRAAP